MAQFHREKVLHETTQQKADSGRQLRNISCTCDHVDDMIYDPYTDPPTPAATSAEQPVDTPHAQEAKQVAEQHKGHA